MPGGVSDASRLAPEEIYDKQKGALVVVRTLWFSLGKGVFGTDLFYGLLRASPRLLKRKSTNCGRPRRRRRRRSRRCGP